MRLVLVLTKGGPSTSCRVLEQKCVRWRLDFWCEARNRENRSHTTSPGSAWNIVEINKLSILGR